MSDIIKIPAEAKEIIKHKRTGKVYASKVDFDNDVADDSVYGAISIMTDGLRKIVSGIKETTLQLSDSAEKTSIIAEKTSTSIETQVNETNCPY